MLMAGSAAAMPRYDVVKRIHKIVVENEKSHFVALQVIDTNFEYATLLVRMTNSLALGEK